MWRVEVGTAAVAWIAHIMPGKQQSYGTLFDSNKHHHAAFPPPPLPGLQGVTFACVNAAVPEGEGTGAAEDKAAAAPAAAPKLATFALRIKAPEVLDEFVAAVNAHKAGGSGGKKEA